MPGLTAFIERLAEASHVSRETDRIKCVERLYILEELIELGLSFQGHTPILIERVCQPIQCEHKTLRALAEQLVCGPLRGEFRVRGRERGQ